MGGLVLARPPLRASSATLQTTDALAKSEQRRLPLQEVGHHSEFRGHLDQRHFRVDFIGLPRKLRHPRVLRVLREPGDHAAAEQHDGFANLIAQAFTR